LRFSRFAANLITIYQINLIIAKLASVISNYFKTKYDYWLRRYKKDGLIPYHYQREFENPSIGDSQASSSLRIHSGFDSVQPDLGVALNY